VKQIGLAPVRFGRDPLRQIGRVSLEVKQGMDMKKQTLMVAVMGALAAGAMVGGATIALAQADVIKQRQETARKPPPRCAASRA
jgi:hypothetical protein